MPADSDHLTGHLGSENIDGGSDWGAVAVLDLDKVGIVEAGRTNPYKKLPAVRLRLGPVADRGNRSN
jgi:hypothetical protein